MSTPYAAYESLVAELKQIALLSSVASVLGWDERTQMPPKGAEHRSAQSALLARMVHERFTSPRLGEWLSAVEASDLVRDRESDPAVNVRETRRSYDRAVKLPAALVEEMARTEVLAQQAWAVARKQSDYPAFEPWLGKVLHLVKQAAACVGDPQRPYDALLDEYEPGETVENLANVFASLRGPLVDLVGRIASSGREAPVEILKRHFPVAAQQALARYASERIGFDFDAGRLDTSVHPFCAGLGPGDTRLTTRYAERDFSGAFFGVLHETGHGLYDQGLDRAHYGAPRGRAVSLGIHESQSRLWENLVGRSRSFWQFFLPKARAAFPEALADVSADDWLFAINDVRPSLIRTEADEATYNLHVLVRFEIELGMVAGDITPADVPAAWNEQMRKYLGLTPPDDARGCLQDIHWSSCAIGYFPTYTLGNLYAAQFFEQATLDLGDLGDAFSCGEFTPLLAWLRKNIHRHGQRFTASQLVKKVTGKELSAAPLLKHLNAKAAELYGV